MKWKRFLVSLSLTLQTDDEETNLSMVDLINGRHADDDDGLLNFLSLFD